jgi:hypothetical protein
MPACLERMAAQVEAATAAGRCLSMVLTGCRRLDEQGRPAEQRYFGTWRSTGSRAGSSSRPSGSVRRVAGAPPWNIGSLAISAETYRVMAGFYREEIGLTVDLEMATRAAAYGPVGYVDEPLLEFTVRGDSMTNTFSRRMFDRDAILPPVAAALVSALAVHEHRRTVGPGERRLVMAQVADQLIGRALMHRYLDGGRGRVGAVRDLLRATYHDPRWLVSGRQLARATAAVVMPARVLAGLKQRFMAAAATSDGRRCGLELDPQCRRVERRVPVVVVPAGDRAAVALVPARVRLAVRAVPVDPVAADLVSRAGVVGLVPDVDPDVRRRTRLAVDDVVDDLVVRPAGDEDPDLAGVQQGVVPGDRPGRAAVAQGDPGADSLVQFVPSKWFCSTTSGAGRGSAGVVEADDVLGVAAAPLVVPDVAALDLVELDEVGPVEPDAHGARGCPRSGSTRRGCWSSRRR